MYEPFTDKARRILTYANQEAQRLMHEYIGTEHILLGLVMEGSGVAANVLKNLGADLPIIRLEVEKIVKPGAREVKDKNLPLTPRSKKVIEYAIEESKKLTHNYVGTEHLLLGLLREEEGVASQVLMNLGLTFDETRKQVFKLLGQNLDVLESGRSQGKEVIRPDDSNKAFSYLPDEFLAIMREINTLIKSLRERKVDAVAEQDFVNAELLRDREVSFKRRLHDIFLSLETLLREFHNEPDRE